MRIGRFAHGDEVFFGRVEGHSVVRIDGDPFERIRVRGEQFALSTLQFLPVTAASKVVAVGVNYRSHAAEMNRALPAEPLLFLKPSSALNASKQPIVLPPESEEVHHEAELALVIGQRIRNVSEAEAANAIFALTCFNDVTARDLQRKDVQFTRAKSFDSFACVGPWMVTGLSPADLSIVCRVNGEVRQEGRTSDMVFGCARLVSFISHVMTLFPGDIVTTGTPAGVGRIAHGDLVEVEIEGIGTLVNPVQRAQ